MDNESVNFDTPRGEGTFSLFRVSLSMISGLFLFSTIGCYTQFTTARVYEPQPQRIVIQRDRESNSSISEEVELQGEDIVIERDNGDIIINNYTSPNYSRFFGGGFGWRSPFLFDSFYDPFWNPWIAPSFAFGGAWGSPWGVWNPYWGIGGGLWAGGIFIPPFIGGWGGYWGPRGGGFSSPGTLSDRSLYNRRSNIGRFRGYDGQASPSMYNSNAVPISETATGLRPLNSNRRNERTNGRTNQSTTGQHSTRSKTDSKPYKNSGNSTTTQSGTTSTRRQSGVNRGTSGNSGGSVQSRPSSPPPSSPSAPSSGNTRSGGRGRNN